LRKRITSRFRKLTEHQTIRTKKKNTPRHLIIKPLNIQKKERMLKAAKEKRQVTYKSKPTGITTDFSAHTLNARRSWKDIFQALKENNCHPIYPAKLSFLN
jgi:hypothetical protein